MRSQSETMELIAFLLEHGAVHVKVGDTVEAIFPPPAMEAQLEEDAWAETREPSLREWAEYQPLPRVK